MDPVVGRFNQRDGLGLDAPTRPWADLLDGPRGEAIRVRRQYHDGMGLYVYVGAKADSRVDPSGLCRSSLEYYGHADGITYDLETDDFIPTHMQCTYPHGEPLYPYMIKNACNELCNGATLWLGSCYIGNNTDYMRALGAACCKIKSVCGFTGVYRMCPRTMPDGSIVWRPCWRQDRFSGWRCMKVNRGDIPENLYP
jgi:hypothetical protein